jgi:hypothetical protein
MLRRRFARLSRSSDRSAGGGVVGLRCQSPYRSGTEQHVKGVIAWVRKHAPELLPPHRA